jgi:hypothetical protein
MNRLLVRAVSTRTGVPPDIVEQVAEGIVDWLKDHPDAMREVVGRSGIPDVDLPAAAFRLGKVVRRLRDNSGGRV